MSNWLKEWENYVIICLGDKNDGRGTEENL